MFEEMLKEAACFEMNWLFNKFPGHFERHATMLQSNDSSGDDPIAEMSPGLDTPRDMLTEILRAGAQKMLAAAIEQEVAEYVADRTGLLDEGGRRQVVRNGFLPEREIMTGVGKVSEFGSPNSRRIYRLGRRDVTTPANRSTNCCELSRMIVANGPI